MPAIPTRNRVTESIVIPDTIANVWETIRALHFEWNPIVESVSKATEATVGSLRTVTYKDKTVQTIKLVALDDITYALSYDLLTSTPAVTYSSMFSTFQLYPITFDNTTLVTWTTEFSNDATLQVIEDNKYKKLDGLKELRVFTEKLKKKRAGSPVPASSPKKAKA